MIDANNDSLYVLRLRIYSESLASYAAGNFCSLCRARQFLPAELFHSSLPRILQPHLV